MIYADDPEAAHVVGKSAWAEADAEALEWGMGRADLSDRSILAHWGAKLARAKAELLPRVPEGVRASFAARIDTLERVHANLTALTSRGSVGPRQEHLIDRFKHQVVDLRRDMKQQIALARRAAGREAAGHPARAAALRRRAEIEMERDARAASRYEERMRQRGLAQDFYGGSEIAGEMGDLWTAIGLKSPLSRYEEKGMKLPEIFARFSASLDRYAKIVPRIPSKSTRRSLSKELGSLQRERASLAPAFAVGATPGKRDRDRLGNFVGGVKGFRSRLKNAMKFYGIRAELPEPDAAPPAPLQVTAEEARRGEFPLLLIGGGLIAAKALGII